MSLLRHARKHVQNPDAYRALNGFIQHAGSHEAETNRTQHERSNKPLDGWVIAIKDNIATSDLHTTCGSAFLHGYSSPFPATVVQKLRDAGAKVAGTTNLDEFGMGSDSIYSFYGPVKNASSQNHSAGGSSGGSAVAVRTEQCHAALGTDTGGSVRLPAAYNGIVGFKPSYGLVSRWGVVAYANSLDTVGVLAPDVLSTQSVFDVINSHDPRDPTSMDHETRERIRNNILGSYSGPAKGLRVGVPKEYITAEMQIAVRGAWTRILDDLRTAGHQIEAISLPSTKLSLSAYYVLATSEASSNLARYDGVRYGDRPEAAERGPSNVLYSHTRGQQFGEEVRRRIVLGAFSLSAKAIDNYFIQAQKVRRQVQADFNRVFAQPHPLLERRESGSEQHKDARVDIIIAPTAQSLAPTIGDLKHRDPTEAYSTDILTVPASLAGLPAINLPVPIPPESQAAGDPSQTAGIQVIGQYGTDDAILEIARYIERLHER